MVGIIKQHKVKITVLKRVSPSEVFEKSPVTPVEALGAWELFREGQEFIVEDGRMPSTTTQEPWHSV